MRGCRAGGGTRQPLTTARRVVRDSLAVGLAVGTAGLSFGAAGSAAGLSVPQTCTLSLAGFTGASQFALVGVIGAGGAPLAGVASALLLGTRNTLYAVRLAPLLRRRRPLAAHLVIDESSGMSFGQSDPELARLAFWVTGLAVFVTWNLATLVGAVGAQAIGDPRAIGLDVAVPAAFLALLWPRLGTGTARAVALLAGLMALAVVPVLPTGAPVLVGALAVLPWVLRR